MNCESLIISDNFWIFEKLNRGNLYWTITWHCIKKLPFLTLRGSVIFYIFIHNRETHKDPITSEKPLWRSWLVSCVLKISLSSYLFLAWNNYNEGIIRGSLVLLRCCGVVYKKTTPEDLYVICVAITCTCFTVQGQSCIKKCVKIELFLNTLIFFKNLKGQKILFHEHDSQTF